MLTEIKAVHKRSRKTYGSPRIYAELNETGHAFSRYRVARLMRQPGYRYFGASDSGFPLLTASVDAHAIEFGMRYSF